VLDLIRLAEDRWLARAATTRPDGTPVSIEEVLVCEGMPNVEVVIDVRGDHTFLVLRERQDPEHVLVERAISPATPPLRVVGRVAVGRRPRPAHRREADRREAGQPGGRTRPSLSMSAEPAPSTAMTWPEMKRADSVHRNITQ
jgi:hypothetical protein